MSFVPVAVKGEVTPGLMKAVQVNSTHILLINLAGDYYAIGNICKHQGCPLSAGILMGEIIVCACHNSRYNVKTGAVVGGPATEPEPTYEVQVDRDQILVKL